MFPFRAALLPFLQLQVPPSSPPNASQQSFHTLRQGDAPFLLFPVVAGEFEPT